MLFTAQLRLGAGGLLVGCLLTWGCGGKSTYTDCPPSTGGAFSDTTGGATAIDISTDGCPTYPDTSSSWCPNIVGQICSETRLQSDIRAVNMLLVVDRSSSMNQPHPSGNGLSNWDTMLSSLGATLTQFGPGPRGSDARVNFGLELFPYDPARSITSNDLDPNVACGVPVDSFGISVNFAPGTSRLGEVFDVLSSQVPGGYAPTAQALREALDYFSVGEGRCARGSHWIMLVTNGAGNCNQSLNCTADSCTLDSGAACSNSASCCEGAGYLCADDAAVVDAINQLKSAGVQTYVVGTAPNSRLNRASLNAYAQAGGVPNVTSASGDAFYSITDSSAVSDLINALNGITEQLVKTCDIQLFSTPQAQNLRVFADCQEILDVSDDAGSGGYIIDTSQSPPHLKLVGGICQEISTIGVHHLDILNDCRSSAP